MVLVHLLALSCGAPTTLMPPLTSAEANLTLEGKTVSQSVLGGCLFADKFYGVGSTWHPNLDSFGTYYCIDCLCEESHDGTGDVYCTNVENNCPLLDCRLQYVPKEKCCRKCWEGANAPSGVITYNPDDPLLFRGEFLALLTGSQSNPPVRTFAVGFGHFIVTLSTVHYSLQFHGIGEISGIEIVSSSHQTVAYSIPNNIHNHRICGVWSDVDDTWLNMLLDEKLQIVVRTEKFPRGELFSDIFYKENEWIDNYRSLLKPHSTLNSLDIAGGGGLGMFKLYPAEQKLKFVVTIDGISDVSNAYIYTHANDGTKHKHSHRKILYNFYSLYRPQIQSFIGEWPVLRDTELEWLARGLLHVTVHGKNPGQELTGQIIVTTTCSGLSAVLSGFQPPLKLHTGAGASGLFELTDDGSLTFEVSWVGLEGQLTSIGFYEPLHMNDTDSLDLQLLHNITDTINETNEEASGIWNKLSASELSLLTDGIVHVTICTDLYKNGEITGRIQRLLFNSHQKMKKELSVTLTGSQAIPFQYTGIAGQAWFSHDCYCALHYRIAIQGLSVTDHVETAYIKGPAPEGYEGPVIYDIIDSFRKHLAVGMIKYPDSNFYSLLHQGFLYLEVATGDTKIRGQLKLQTKCQRSTYDFIRPKKTSEFKNCTFEGTKYLHGQMWHPPAKRSSEIDCCVSCHCRDGGVLCLLNADDQYCPVCDGTSSSSSSGFDIGMHPSSTFASFPKGSTMAKTSLTTTLPNCSLPDLPVGECEVNGHIINVTSRWYPYLTDYGLMHCIICECVKGDNGHAEVKCNSPPCPPLECNATVSRRDGDCCPSCEEATEVPRTATSTPAGCELGGNQYQDGEEFMPVLPIIGPLPCVQCICTSGSVKCDWPCPEVNCDHPIQQLGECCETCPATDTSYSLPNR